VEQWFYLLVRQKAESVGNRMLGRAAVKLKKPSCILYVTSCESVHVWGFFSSKLTKSGDLSAVCSRYTCIHVKSRRAILLFQKTKESYVTAKRSVLPILSKQ